jgi:very-short-patch-repair endonuclease
VCAGKHPHAAFLNTPLEGGLAALAFAQHGVVAVAQLRARGIHRGAIASWRQRGLLHPLHRGVYAVGHARLDFHGRLWAAVLARNAAVSHRSVAPLWDLMPISGGRIEVTTFGAAHSDSKLLVHRSRTLRPDDVVTLDGLPVTSPTRTIQDLAQVLTPHRLERVLHTAEHLRILDAAKLATPLPGRRSTALHRGLEALAAGEPQLTKSEAENAMVAVLDRAGLPRPEVNPRLLGYIPDFLWREQRLIAETDGRRTHLTPTAFETDRERDARYLVAGYRVVRFTYRQLVREPEAVASTIAALLARR